jgi:hypothetical protein
LNGFRTGLRRPQKEESAGAQEGKLNSHEKQPNGETAVAGLKHSDEAAGGKERGEVDEHESTREEETSAGTNVKTAAQVQAAQSRGQVEHAEAKQREEQAEAADRQAEAAAVAPTLSSRNQVGRDEERAATNMGVAVAEKTAEAANEAKVPAETGLDAEGEAAQHKAKEHVQDKGEAVAQYDKETTSGENSFVAEYRNLLNKEAALAETETETGEGAKLVRQAPAEAAPTAPTTGKVSRFSSMLEMGKKAASMAKQVRVCPCPSLPGSVCPCPSLSVSVCLWLSLQSPRHPSHEERTITQYVALPVVNDTVPCLWRPSAPP